MLNERSELSNKEFHDKERREKKRMKSECRKELICGNSSGTTGNPNQTWSEEYWQD